MLELPNRFNFEGHRIAWGALGEGPPLVLVHGTPFSSQVWRRIAPWLARRHRVYFYDLLGYGQSDMPDADVSLGRQNALFGALLNEWKLARPRVLAHDYGGATALRAHFLDGIAYADLTLVNPVAIALGFEDLMRSDDFARVRQCGRCTWFFVDRGRGVGRRWCDMRTCGNRAKVEAFRER